MALVERNIWRQNGNWPKYNWPKPKIATCDGQVAVRTVGGQGFRTLCSPTSPLTRFDASVFRRGDGTQEARSKERCGSVCSEAGGRVTQRSSQCPRGAQDQSRPKVVGDGFPLFHGAQLSIDTTLMSALRGDGRPGLQCVRVDGASIMRARRRKETPYWGERTCPVGAPWLRTGWSMVRRVPVFPEPGRQNKSQARDSCHSRSCRCWSNEEASALTVSRLLKWWRKTSIPVLGRKGCLTGLAKCFHLLLSRKKTSKPVDQFETFYSCAKSPTCVEMSTRPCGQTMFLDFLLWDGRHTLPRRFIVSIGRLPRFKTSWPTLKPGTHV